jgi:hypothetical protein
MTAADAAGVTATVPGGTPAQRSWQRPIRMADTPVSSFMEIAPVDLLKSLPDALKPEGFKQ